MILRTRLTHFFLPLFLFTAFTAAWPWPPSYADIGRLLIRRQDGSKSDSTSASPSATQGSSAAASSASQTASPSGSAAPTSGKSESNSQSGSGSKTVQSGSKTVKGSASATSASITEVDPRLPAGGVNMLTPSPLEKTYYKIGETVTFGWNYTSLSIPPSKIDIVVTCSTNNALYTISNNASFASSGSVLWDTAPEETGTAPLLTGEYNLIIHDAAKDPSAVASAGQLGSLNQLAFKMYARQSYTGINDGWVCAVCSAALSDTERQALKFMFAMAAITVLSFTWFVGGFGAFI